MVRGQEIAWVTSVAIFPSPARVLANEGNEMSTMGQSRPGRARAKSGHARYAPIATKFHGAARRRDGPIAVIRDILALHSHPHDQPDQNFQSVGPGSLSEMFQAHEGPIG